MVADAEHRAFRSVLRMRPSQAQEKEEAVARYDVHYSAVYSVTEEVEADSPEEAVRLVKDGGGMITDESYNRHHPDTDYEINGDYYS